MELRLKSLIAAGLILLSCVEGRAQTGQREIARFIDEKISAPPFDRFILGIRVEEEDGRTLYDLNGDRLFIPASVRKLFTAATVASCAALDSTISTELWLDGEIMNGVFLGDVVMKGYGDPSLAGRYVLDRDETLRPFLGALRKLGIRRISGSVVADVSAFSAEVTPDSWTVSDLGTSYGQLPDAIAFNESIVGVFVRAPSCDEIHVTTDPAFVPFDIGEIECPSEDALVVKVAPGGRVVLSGKLDPAAHDNAFLVDLVSVPDAGLYAAQALTDFLSREGIAVSGEPRSTRKPVSDRQPNRKSRARQRKIASIESPPLHLLLTTMLQESENVYSEMLLKRLAIGKNPASYETALEQERRLLEEEIGLEPGSFSFEDGSGLSSDNLVSPHAAVKIARHPDAPARRKVFFEMLPRPGGAGTLNTRLLPLGARVRAKTGTIRGVISLAGYVRGSNDTTRYFAILINHHRTSSSAARALIDAIVTKIAEF